MLQWRRQTGRYVSPGWMFSGRPCLLVDSTIKIKPLHLSRTSETTSSKLSFDKFFTFPKFESGLVGFFISLWAVEALAHHCAQWAVVFLGVHQVLRYSLSHKQQDAASFQQPNPAYRSHPPDPPLQQTNGSSKTPLQILSTFIVTAAGLTGLCLLLRVVHIFAGYYVLLAFAFLSIHYVAVAPYLTEQLGTPVNEKGKGPTHEHEARARPSQEQTSGTSQVRTFLFSRIFWCTPSLRDEYGYAQMEFLLLPVCEMEAF